MNRKATVAVLTILAFNLSSSVIAQGPQAPTGQKTLAATINVYAFPNKGQSPKQQSMEESDCYDWAVDQTGTDPFSLGKQAQQQAAQAEQARQEAKQAGQGSGARGALRGAARGALIGEIANDDAGKGAAIGAATGMIRGNRRRQQEKQAARSEIDQLAAQQKQYALQQGENFKKAFSVCLESKDYRVKY